MALEQVGFRVTRLGRTGAARSLDPSEKGAINYFLGMTVCKLFAAKLLDTPWVLHLDVFKDHPQVRAVLTQRSRPDLVGQSSTGDWRAFEAKGRISPPDATAKTKAKQQARRIASVGGSPPVAGIGCITHFKRDVLQFYWRDPLPEGPGRGIPIPFEDVYWSYYYRPVFDTVAANPDALGAMLRGQTLTGVETADLQVGIHPKVLQWLVDASWGEAKAWCDEHRGALREEGYQADGIRIEAGRSWLEPYEEAPTPRKRG